MVAKRYHFDLQHDREKTLHAAYMLLQQAFVTKNPTQNQTWMTKEARLFLADNVEPIPEEKPKSAINTISDYLKTMDNVKPKIAEPITELR